MGDIKNPKLIIFKGLLFLFTGLFAAGGLLLEQPTLRVAFLLAVSIWAFARFYYFAFYVVEHYVDPGFRFAGLGAFALYLLRRRSNASLQNSAVSAAPPTQPNVISENRPGNNDVN